MKLSLVTAPAVEPLLLAQVKDHVRVSGTDEDAYLGQLISTVTSHLDGWAGIMGRALISQTWDLFLDWFPWEIAVPLPPLQSVTTVKYTDNDGVQQTLATSVYTVVSQGNSTGKIVQAFNQTWPTIRMVPNAVEIQFVAGYGDSWNDVPLDIRHAMLILIGQMYEYREEVVTGTMVSRLPDIQQSLLFKHRVGLL